jgi:site-specific recombinase XerC
MPPHIGTPAPITRTPSIPASYMTAATGDLWRVKAWMGHSSVTVTEIYAHHLPQHDDAAEQSAGQARLRKREAA